MVGLCFASYNHVKSILTYYVDLQGCNSLCGTIENVIKDGGVILSGHQTGVCGQKPILGMGFSIIVPAATPLAFHITLKRYTD